MTNTRSFYLILVVVLGLTLAACERPASTPMGTAVVTEYPFPISTQPNAINEILTQTAAAAMPKSEQETGGETPAATEAPPAPTEAPEEEVVVPTAEVPSTYVLQKGEYPYCIARRFDVDAGALLNLNGWSTNAVVSPGTTVRIPQGTSWSSGSRALKSHPTSYTVVAGDTIYTIACAFGDVDPNAIIVVNGLESPYTLTSGQTLDIP